MARHVDQRTRAKPCSSGPQSRKRPTSATAGRSGAGGDRVVEQSRGARSGERAGSGFRDRPIQPLSHLSASVLTRTYLGRARAAKGTGCRSGYRMTSRTASTGRHLPPLHLSPHPVVADPRVALRRNDGRVTERLSQRRKAAASFQPAARECVPLLMRMELRDATVGPAHRCRARRRGRARRRHAVKLRGIPTRRRARPAPALGGPRLHATASRSEAD